MNRLILFTFLMSSGFLAAADVPEAKKAFATFVENQKNDNPRAIEQFAPDCRVTMVQSDGKMNFEHQVPFNEFKKVLEVASKRKEGTDETYDEVVFNDQGESVSVNGTVHYSDPDFSGPFSLVLAKVGREEGLRITDFKIYFSALYFRIFKDLKILCYKAFQRRAVLRSERINKLIDRRPEICEVLKVTVAQALRFY